MLEKYRGAATRHTCPSCGRAKKFTRYVDNETGQPISESVGRCDRESKCGYHLSPREYFDRHQLLVDSFTGKRSDRRNMRSERKIGVPYPSLQVAKPPDSIEKQHLIETLGNYDTNNFVRFLSSLQAGDFIRSQKTIKDYCIGTGSEGRTIFWQIDYQLRIRTGKIIQYDSKTGNRKKDCVPSWIHTELKRKHILREDFQLEQCFFGEHLLADNPGMPIGIVEAEKTAVICSMFPDSLPRMLWLACGGKTHLSINRLENICSGRTLLLFPDADAYATWAKVADEARGKGISIEVSSLLEDRASDEDKANGADLADFLIRNHRMLIDYPPDYK